MIPPLSRHMILMIFFWVKIVIEERKNDARSVFCIFNEKYYLMHKIQEDTKMCLICIDRLYFVNTKRCEIHPSLFSLKHTQYM